MNRRNWSRHLLALTGGIAASARAASQGGAAASSKPERLDIPAEGGLTDVAGLKVGHFTEKRRPTGCTVVLCEAGAVAGVDVRGSAPGTRETDLLNPVNTVQQVHAILLSGGSAYGLDAAGGVMRYLRERGIGYKIGSNVVPIVPAAILFDLGLGDASIWPTAESGYQACLVAKAGKVPEGNVGAGAGAIVGKLFGLKSAMKSGLGTASLRVGDTGIVVSAIVAVNAVGDVINPKSGRIVAGARTTDGKGFVDSMARIRAGYNVKLPPPPPANTTIGVVATNVAFDKAQVTKIAQMAHDGLARCITPVHTPADGDTIFALATGALGVKANHGMIGAIAADVMAQAVLRAILAAEGIPGLPSYRDLL
ncbi:MAG: P1 family peptidase [Acidobacteria bacterium]|nr:P1 family peptidase [Acidobacteriota bacterium]